MYHMLPFSYRPQANYSRAQHGEFQNIVESFVDKILSETEIVDSQCPNGRKLFNSIDTFFSYGLLTADGAYWRCIRDFLPRAEQKMLIAECGNANDRFLSIGWLKTSFNKGTLHFMLLALNNQSNKVYLTRYYHSNACIRNSGLLEAITNFIEKLNTVQFAFYSTRQLRAEAAPAAVIDTASVQISSRAAARQRKLTEKEASSDTVPNVVPTEVPSILTQAIDQDVLLDELVRNRHNRLNNEMYEEEIPAESEVKDESLREATEEKLEDVMTKKMSCANMELLDPDGIEDILANAAPEEVSLPVYNLADGEYLMSQGDILHFAINVFERSSEKIIETFKVVESFHSDDRKIRYFVMTNYNLYVFKYRVHSKNASPGRLTNISSEGFFIPTIRMPHDRIKTIKIGVDNLTFMVESNEMGFTYFIHNEEKDDQTCYSYFAAMAGMESGAHMINALINVVEHTSRPQSVHLEIDDHIGYMCLLQPNLERILNHSIDIRNAFLCFWYEQSREEQAHTTTSISGFLFKTNVNMWIKSSEEAQHVFCMIIGNNFHVFTDSTCKTEELVIDLKATTFAKGGRSTFQLKSSSGNYEFECSTLEQCSEWTKTLSVISEKTTGEPYVTPCLAVITQSSLALVQEGEKFWNDGFLRLLNNVKINNMGRAFVVFPDDKKSVFATKPYTLCIVTLDNVAHYFFVRFAKELERFANMIHSLCNLQCKKLEEGSLNDQLEKTVHNTCCSIKDMWPI